MSDLDTLSINTLRFLAVDAVEKANSGHPGAPLGDAPIAYLLFHKYMRHNPANANWSNRDRFILSNGHASAMLYSVLHLSGYKVSIADLEQFRQWDSITPGHPERGDTEGVEVTTGPLGQGLAMSVGMAMAEKHLAARYNKPGLNVVDHYTYVMCGDGDLMEGVSHEACSLAGTLGLGKLILFYDDNLVSLDGPTDLSFTEDVAERFEAYHWHVQHVSDGNNLLAIENAVTVAQAVTDRPSLIAVRTVIGYGSPKAGTSKAHGEPLGAEDVKKTKETLGWPADKTFYVPEEAQKNWDAIRTRGAKEEADWNALFATYKQQFPELAAEYERVFAGKLPAGWESSVPKFAGDAKPVATRVAGNTVLNAIAGKLPELIGGAADLSSSTKTVIKDSGNFHLDPAGRNIYFGVREFGMCAAVNGMAAHGGLIPYGSTFFVFSDYCRPALRLAALMQTPSLFVFTHDSIGLGQDGPTHQPIEQLASLRAMPGLVDFRPADANETAAAWQVAIERRKPVFMALSRQDLPVLDPAKHDILNGVRHGAYILEDGGSSPDIILLATGSEVSLVQKAAVALKSQGIAARVVSMPSCRLFEEQDDAYKATIFPDPLPVLAVEAGSPLSWWKYVGRHGDVIGLDRFGASAPGEIAMDKLGFNVPNVVEHAQKLVARARVLAGRNGK
ncbi:MAG TPA: transketolase [Acidobacteriaceae bacterium]|jgi:transketolase|nr:transketolase [Acidobacteriaceae bacterium]